MNRFTYLLAILILLLLGACKKTSLQNSRNSFVKFFPADTNYQTGGCFQLTDGNFIIYGFDPEDVGIRPLIIKCDESGNVIWKKNLSTAFHYLKINPLKEGGMLAVGIGLTDSSINICKLGGVDDSVEIFIAHRPEIKALATINYLPDFVIEDNGDISILSHSRIGNYKLPFILRTDPLGGFVSYKVYDTIAIKINFRTAGIVRWEYGYYITGSADDKNKEYKGIFCACLDNTYNTVWDSVLFDDNTVISAAGIINTPDNSGAVIFGEHQEDGSDGNLFARLIDGLHLGAAKSYSSYPNYATSSSINKASNGYVMAATVNMLPFEPQILSYSKMYIMKVDASSLQQVWTNEFNSDLPITAACAVETSDGGYLLAGYEHSASYVYTMVLIKTDATGNIVYP